MAGHRTPATVALRRARAEFTLRSAGRRGLEVEIAPADLVHLTSATTAPIAAP